MRFIFNSNSKELVPRKASRKHHHSGERSVGSLWGGEVGHRVGMHARAEGREGRCCLGHTQSTEPKARTRLPNRETHSHNEVEGNKQNKIKGGEDGSRVGWQRKQYVRA